MEGLCGGKVGEEKLGFLLDGLPLGLGGVGDGAIAPLSVCLRSEGVDEEGEQAEVLVAGGFGEKSKCVDEVHGEFW